MRLIGRHNGRQFLDRNITKFALGEGSEIDVVEGVEQGLRSMKAGERALLRIKAKYAYGTEGCQRPSVPPNADVEFDVDLESYDPVFCLFIYEILFTVIVLSLLPQYTNTQV